MSILIYLVCAVIFAGGLLLAVAGFVLMFGNGSDHVEGVLRDFIEFEGTVLNKSKGNTSRYMYEFILDGELWRYGRSSIFSSKHVRKLGHRKELIFYRPRNKILARSTVVLMMVAGSALALLAILLIFLYIISS